MIDDDLGLYRIERKDIQKAGSVLADAFSIDPAWKKALEDVEFKYRCNFFQGAVRYCLKYGKVLATSENIEGVAVWIPGDLADMTFWRYIRSGSFFAGLKHGIKMTKMAIRIRPIFDPLEVDRKKNMKGRDHIYFMIMGVASEHQGKGMGNKLAKAVIAESEEEQLPIYVETATERNVEWYERLGFKVLKKITLPIIDLPQWEMIREPEK